jgi:hypothetical protein
MHKRSVFNTSKGSYKPTYDGSIYETEFQNVIFAFRENSYVHWQVKAIQIRGEQLENISKDTIDSTLINQDVRLRQV